LSAIVEPLTPEQGRPFESATNQMSAYFLELEGLLSRIESATTYYQVLGIDRTDPQEKIKSSFDQLVNLLYPSYAVGKAMPAEILSRVERAFSKASQAFGALASFTRRKEYDGALLSIGNKTHALGEPTPSHPQLIGERPSTRRSEAAAVAETDDLRITRMPSHREVYGEFTRVKTGDNRRRCERFKISVPARVTGYDQKSGKWNEMTETIDVSRTGVRLRLRRRVKHGMVLFLTLPLPGKLRSHGFAEQTYNVYTLVRRIEPPKHGVRAIGVEFLGEHPPAGFLDKPWAVFRATRWGGSERRRPEREDRSELVRIEYFDEAMQSISREEARTENISRSGVRIVGTRAPAEFDLIMVNCPRLRFEGLAALRNRYVGKDGLERICLQFVDKEWPLRS